MAPTPSLPPATAKRSARPRSAIDLAQAGFGVFVVADAVSSRAEASVALALTRMGQSGIEIINTEMAVFELLGKAGTPEFRALSGLIK